MTTSADLAVANLKNANLSNANLNFANLEDANLEDSNLTFATLSYANLNFANFSRAELVQVDLSTAKLIGVDFKNIDLRYLGIDEHTQFDFKWREVWRIMTEGGASKILSGIDLSFAYLRGANLSFSYLKSTNLECGDLIGATLDNANLDNANLKDANLRQIQALRTNFSGAILTGVCIEDWNINTQTNLENVKCDYIYLKSIFLESEKKWVFTDRRPHNPNKIFAPGEFTKLFQQALDTVDLIFSEGIEWAAFLESFQQLQAEVKSEDLSIQAIEKKKGGAFVVRLEVPEEANKAEIEKYIKQEYETKLKVIEANYQKKLKGKDETIKSRNEELIKAYQQKGTDLLEMARLMSQNQQKNIIEFKPTMTSGNNYNTENAGIVHNENSPISDDAKIAGIINEAAPQDLAQAAAEIQQLLDQLQQTNGVTLETAQQQTAKDLATKANSDPQFKDKLINLSKFVGENSAKTLIGEGVKGVLKLLLFMLL